MCILAQLEQLPQPGGHGMVDGAFGIFPLRVRRAGWNACQQRRDGWLP
jgi:hypothetical protein